MQKSKYIEDDYLDDMSPSEIDSVDDAISALLRLNAPVFVARVDDDVECSFSNNVVIREAYKSVDNLRSIVRKNIRVTQEISEFIGNMNTVLEFFPKRLVYSLLFLQFLLESIRLFFISGSFSLREADKQKIINDMRVYRDTQRFQSEVYQLMLWLPKGDENREVLEALKKLKGALWSLGNSERNVAKAKLEVFGLLYPNSLEENQLLLDEFNF